MELWSWMRENGWPPMAAFLLVLAAQASGNLAGRLKIPGTQKSGTVQKWDPRVVHWMASGYSLAVADGLWIRFLQGEELSWVASGVRAGSFYDLDLATDLDPWFFDPYQAGAAHLVVIRNDIDGGQALLDKAMRLSSEAEPGRVAALWPDLWWLHLELAYLKLFERKDLLAAARHFEAASRSSRAPAYLRHLTARLNSPGGIEEVGAKVLEFFIRQATDPVLRDRYLEQRRSLAVIMYVRALRSEFNRFRAGAGEGPRGAWPRFLSARVPSGLDPWGGRLFLNPSDLPDSDTPREPVLGLPSH
ncbi:MAG TPA: hypothetical protein VL588_00095 [Bdellovibrionota bacterium]|nr:hypothetical protein [Bdellovibrionota bacterium]